MSRWLRFVTAQPVTVLTTVLAISLFAASRIVDFRTGEIHISFDPSTNALLPEGDEGRLFYDHVRKVFGSDETILVAVSAEDIFSAEHLRRIQRMGERIEAIEGIHHVVSLSTALNIRGDESGLAIEPFVEEVPDDPAELAEIRRQALSNPIYAGNIVSRDGRTAALMIYLMEMTERELLARGIDEQIRRIAEEERGDAQIWVTGQAYVKAEMSRALLSDLLRTIPLVALAITLVAFLSFRSFFGALVPLITVGIALLWTLAILVTTGRALNVITVVLPPLILAIGFAYAAHVVSEYYDLLRTGEAEKTHRETVEKALGLVALPVALTGLTTAIGFLSLAISPLTAIREFGLFTTAGVVITMLVSLTFGPALLCLLRPPRRLRQAVPEAAASAFDRLARATAQFAIRRRIAILSTGAAIGLFSAYGVTQIVVSTDVVKLFHPQHRVRVDFEAVNDNLEGSDAVYVVLEAPYRDAFKEPENLASVEHLQLWLEEQPNIGGTTSVVDYVKLIHRGFMGDTDELVIPESKELVAQLMFFGGNDEMESFVDSRWQTVSILARSRAIDSADVTELVDRIEAYLVRLPDHLKGRVTGNNVLINQTSDQVALGQAVSLALAFIAIYAVLCLLFTSFRVGLLALVPNMLPVLVYFGALGWTGVTLNTTTGLVACLVLGIAVDDTIHFLARFNSAAKRLGSEAKGVVEALLTVGRPVTYTSLALCLGFLAIATSTLQNQKEFGYLAAFTLGVAWLADVLFTPALAARMRVVTLWDLLTLDLGENPLDTIPLLEGLTLRQARITALMTRMQEHAAGEMLWKAADPGDSMYVVVQGELTAIVPGKHGADRVPLRRGDVVGEIGLFHGERSADVEVTQDCMLMRLTQENLARLQKRYPRIGAQVYRNISHVLADRMARSTARVR
ncbi:MAG: MMPL family transporter [Deltaproteobacteria bacterium]|nr:MMPL family transporter [Deltaproteobacteria bacterium]MBW2360534.1 MMPL family transporter [Deltaproteobacteria bacterium]